ncbi:hypothetical protein QJS10_CPB15g01548 [Acorus calamus]|uniref:Uncharacterized protein n=1 Tax=Acorus calamus TaxID=4465 RepID=A0AAV9D412_ACOCL|nr:hypothetical protein QJS10_CPB15g01548 [Acorus calamus]
MAASPSTFTSSSPAPAAPQNGRDAVYVAAVPLRVAGGPARMMMSAAHDLNMWDLQRYMVALKPPSPHNQIIVYDFQPQNPEDVWVAIAALSSQSVPGVVLERNLKRLPSKSCWFVGLLRPEGLEVAKEFNRRWPTDLKIGHHHCRHYADGNWTPD